jgi:uncharacterized protein (TIGR03435 family)
MKPFIFLMTLVPLFAQPKLAYEVTSVKPNNTGGLAVRIGGAPGGRFTASNVTPRQLILQAYGLQEFQLTGGPGWITSEHFDIEAKPEAGITPTREQTQEMLQSLLEDRFQLKVRRETRDLPVYTLNLAKGGSKLKLSADQTPLTPLAGPPPPPSANSVPRGMVRMAPGYLNGSAMPFAQFVRQLSGQLTRPVLDKTGLTSLYDFDFRWTPEHLPSQLPPGIDLPAVDPNGPSIFAALQEQLGLKLESTTGPVETLIIERIEKPTEN